MANKAICQDQDDCDDVADNHSNSASGVSWGLVCAKGLGADDVSDGPCDVVPGIEADSGRC
jgi:hypothetical protein